MSNVPEGRDRKSLRVIPGQVGRSCCGGGEGGCLILCWCGCGLRMRNLVQAIDQGRGGSRDHGWGWMIWGNEVMLSQFCWREIPS